jgi:hypothetical protein
MLREHLDRVPATVLVSSEHGHGNFAARSMAAPLPLLSSSSSPQRMAFAMALRAAPIAARCAASIRSGSVEIVERTGPPGHLATLQEHIAIVSGRVEARSFCSASGRLVRWALWSAIGLECWRRDAASLDPLPI